MKHTAKVTAMLVIIFFLAQLVGIAILTQYIDMQTTAATGVTTTYSEAYDSVYVEPPQVENESLSFIPIIIAILIGTALVLVLVKFKLKRVWKGWFFLGISYCLLVALNPFVAQTLQRFGYTINAFYVTLAIVLVLTYFKAIRPNVYVHNFTEIFLYGGLVAILLPVVNLYSAFGLLIAISVYDAYAVWKSKHMVKMAQFQAESKVFAGALIPYAPKGTVKAAKKATKKQAKASSKKTETGATAILGGGDIGFPLFFSGAVMKSTGMLIDPIIISLTTALALVLLFMYSEKGKFYPAMPFISVGCFAGYVLTLLI